ncbi:MAG: serine hydrolase domain-containing protein, partial [Planctomycetota bacterium]
MRITVKMLLLSLVITLCGVGFSNTSGDSVPVVDTGSQDIPEVTAAVQELIDDEKLSGAVVAVSYKGKMIHYKAQGLRDVENNERMQKDTVFRIYSMTKPITTVAAMMLWEEGK